MHTFAARAVISKVISLPSSSVWGFWTHTVALRAVVVEKRRVDCKRSDDIEGKPSFEEPWARVVALVVDRRALEGTRKSKWPEVELAAALQ